MATLSSCLTAQTALFVTPSHVHFFSFCFLEMTRAPIFSTLKLTHPISPVCKNHPDIPIFLQVNSSPHTISGQFHAKKYDFEVTISELAFLV